MNKLLSKNAKAPSGLAVNAKESRRQPEVDSGLNGIAQDIRAHKKIEEALHKSETKFRFLAETVPATIAIFQGTDVRYMNTEGYRAFGYTKEELNERGFMRIVHPDFQDLVRERSLARQRGESVCSRYEFKVVTKDGRERWLDFSGSRIEFEGKPSALGVALDVTERKRAEPLLNGAKRFLEPIAARFSLREVLIWLVKLIEGQTDGMLCSILLLEDGTRLRHGAAPSLPKTYQQAIDGIEIGPDVGSCGTAAYLNQKVIVADIAVDPLWKNFRNLALAHDLAACWSAPIRSARAKVLGSFAMYHRTPHTPTLDQENLIERGAHLAAIAIEQHESQRELRASNARRHAIFASASGGIVTINEQGTIQSFTPSIGILFGYPDHELVGENIYILLPDLFAAGHPHTVADILSVHAAIKIAMGSESVARSKHGTRFPIELSFSEMQWDDTRLFTIVIRDITEYKHAEQRIKESEVRYRLLAENVSDVIWTMDLQGRLLYVSPSVERLSGFSPKELTGRSIADVLTPASMTIAQGELLEFHAQYEASAPDTRTSRFELEHLCKGGGTIWTDVAINTVLNPAGEFMFFMGVARDITARRHDREELLKYQGKLRHLTDKLLMIEEDERRRISEDLHDQIGQTTTACKMRIALLSKCLDQPRLKGLAKEALKLLDTTLESTRTLIFDLSPPVLYELGLEAALDWLADRFRDHYAVTIEYENGQQTQSLAKETRFLLFRAAQEMLVNAAKHASAQTVRVRVSQTPEQVQIAVEDDGIGFDLSALEAAKSTPPGVGLFNIRERIGNHGGYMNIDTRPGKGTRIIVRLPRDCNPGTEHTNKSEENYDR